MPGGMLDVGGIEARLGAKVDERGFREFDRAMAKAEKQGATATLEAKVDERGFLRFKALADDADKSTKNLIGRMRDANISTTFFSRTLSLVKWPAFITAAGLATQGILALTGGVVGLTSALAPLSGLLVGYPALLGAIGQAAGVVALAGVNDLTDALGGNEEALKRLTPEGRKFLETLKGFAPEVDKLQKTAQGPLFGGLEKGIDAAAKNFPRLRAVIGRTSEVMGTLAERAGNFLGRDGFGRDFEKIGDTNAKLLGRLGRSGLHFADALRHVLVVAQPLVDWMGKLTVRWGKGAEEAAKAGRHTGRLAEFFEKTRKVAERLFSISGHLAGGFGEIGEAAAPLGRSMLRAFDDAADSFERWTKSVGGKNALREFFRDIRGPLFEMGRLVRDLGGGLLSMGDPSTLKPLIRQIRTELLPPVIEMVTATTAAFGPPLIEFLTELARLMTNFAGSSGPLTLFVKGLTKLTEGLNWIMDSSPVVKSSLVTIMGAFGVISTIGLAKFVSDLFGFRRGMEAIKDFPGAGKVFAKLKSGFETVALAAMEAKDVAADWISNFVGTIRARAGRVRDVMKRTVLRGRAMISAVAGAAAELGGQVIASMTGAIRRGAGRVKDALSRVLRSRAVSGAVQGAAFALGDTLVGRMAGRVRGKSGVFSRVGRFAGGVFGKAFILGAMIFLPQIANELKDMLEDLGVLGKDWTKKGLEESPNIQDKGPIIDLGLADLPVVGGLFGHRGGLVTRRGILPFQGFQFGGMAGFGPPQAPSARDTVPAMLEPGEVVIPKDKVRKGVGSPVGEDAVTDTEKRTKKIRERVEEDFDKAGKAAEKEQKKLERGVGKSWREIDRDHERRSRAMKDRTRDSFGAMADTARARSEKLSSGVQGSMGEVQRAVFAGMDYIADATSKALRAFDAKPIHFSVPKPRDGGGEGRAAGGLIPGYSRTDNRTIRVRGGERVLRPEDHSPFIDALMRSTVGFGLDDYLKQTGGVGYSLGGFVPGYAKGGRSSADKRGGRADTRMAAIVQEANRIDRLKSTYVYGGGHVTPAPATGPWDCSSAVSRLLQAAGYDVPTMVSGDFASRFPAGKGAVSILSNPGHVYAVIGGRAWGTSGENPGGGPGWIDSYVYRPGFSVSHVPGLGQASGIGTAHLNRPEVEGTAGPMRDLAQAAIDAVRGGAQGKLRKAQRRATSMMGQALSEFGGAGGSLPVSAFNRLAGRALRLTGHPATGQNKASLRILSGKESQLNPNAVNPTPVGDEHASGIMQMLPSTFRAYHEPGTSTSIFDALANIASSINYQFARYSGLTTTSPYAAGGLVGGGLRGMYQQLRRAMRRGRKLSAREAEIVARIEGLRGEPRSAKNRRALNELHRRLARVRRRDPGARVDRLRRGITATTIGGYDDLYRAVELGSLDASDPLHRLRVRPGVGLGMLGEYGAERAAQVRSSLRIGAAQQRVFAGFRAGGAVPRVDPAYAGGGQPIILDPNITFIFEEESGAFVGRVRQVVDGREKEVGRSAGLAGYHPSRTGRSAAYGRRR